MGMGAPRLMTPPLPTPPCPAGASGLQSAARNKMQAQAVAMTKPKEMLVEDLVNTKEQLLRSREEQVCVCVCVCGGGGSAAGSSC